MPELDDTAKAIVDTITASVMARLAENGITAAPAAVPVATSVTDTTTASDSAGTDLESRVANLEEAMSMLLAEEDSEPDALLAPVAA